MKSDLHENLDGDQLVARQRNTKLKGLGSVASRPWLCRWMV
jgi:hypothetical protein